MRRQAGQARQPLTRRSLLRATGVGAGAALIDANLAGADDPIQMGARHPLEHLGQEVVEPLSGRAAVDADVSHAWRGFSRRALHHARRCFGLAAFAPYNAMLHSAAKSLIFQSLASHVMAAPTARVVAGSCSGRPVMQRPSPGQAAFPV